MIKIYDFNNVISSGLVYGGHAGLKKGIVFNGESWFLKFPQTTKSMENVNVSYTTAPISEYIGSHIYESIGLPVHQTELGVSNGKVVVACKDFLKDNEIIYDFNMIKNDYNPEMEKALLKLSSSSKNKYGNNIEEIFVVMDNNHYFKEIPELKKRFWNMFIVDALIANNDRNEGNWGLIYNKSTSECKLAPIYDNGSAFSNKADEEKFNVLISNQSKFISSVYESLISIYRENDKPINPIKYIEKTTNTDLITCLKEVMPKIDLEKVRNIIYNIPNKYNDIFVISDVQKEFYYKSFVYRYNKLMEIYNKVA